MQPVSAQPAFVQQPAFQQAAFQQTPAQHPAPQALPPQQYDTGSIPVQQYDTGSIPVQQYNPALQADPNQPGSAPFNPAQPYVAAAPSVLGINLAGAFRTWVKTFVRIFRSDPGVGIDDRSPIAQPATGNPWFWVVAALINGLIASLAMVTSLAMLNSRSGGYLSPDGGMYAAAIFIPIVVSFVYIVARAGAIAAIFGLRSRQISFNGAANLAGVSYVASAPFLAVLVLLAMIPGSFTAVLFLLGFIFTAFLSETSLYVSIAKTGRFDRSATLHFAWLSMVWLVITTFIMLLIFSDTIGTYLNNLTNSWW